MLTKETISNKIREFLLADGCVNDYVNEIFKLTPLTTTIKGEEEKTEIGFSVTIFGVLGFRCYYKGKWKDWYEMTLDFYKSLKISDNDYTVEFLNNSIVKVKILNKEDEETYLRQIYYCCRDNLPHEFDCCHRYMECSDALKCINPDLRRAVLCSYRKKLIKGIVFYGKNRTLK